MHLSRYFMLSEMTRSATAAQHGISNEPAAAEIQNLRTLCTTLLDPLRDALGKPIKVNSGYRSPALNRRIGGSGTSQHVQGRATDIQCPGLSTLQLFKTIIELDLPFDQIIYEVASRSAQWVHLSHDSQKCRGDVRIAKFPPAGKPVTYPAISRLDALALVDLPTMRGAGPLEYIEMADEPDLHETELHGRPD